MAEPMKTRKAEEDPKDLPVQDVRIGDLIRTSSYQIRNRIDQGTVHRYRNVYKNGGDLPPVRVALVDGGAYLVDGWHRIEALEGLGATSVRAMVTEETQEDAHWLAAEANLTHGLPLKAREVRGVFRAYVRARRHREGRRSKTYQQITDDLGGVVALTTIRNWMQRDFPSVFRAMGRKEDEIPKGTGGHRPGHLTIRTPYGIASTALGEALAAFRGIPDPHDAAQIVRKTRELLEELETAGPWKDAEDLEAKLFEDF